MRELGITKSILVAGGALTEQVPYFAEHDLTLTGSSVELLDAAEGKKEVVLDRVLLVQDGGTVKVGTPVLVGAKVVCENLGNFRGPKIVHYRMRRRKSSRRKRGHRQELLKLMVKEIQTA